MQFQNSPIARALLLVALPLSAVAATAQTQDARSTITYQDGEGNLVTKDVAGGLNPAPNLIRRGGINSPSAAGLISKQNIYGQTAPNPTPGNNGGRYGYNRNNYGYNGNYNGTNYNGTNYNGTNYNGNNYGGAGTNGAGYTTFSYSQYPVFPQGYFPYPAPAPYGFPVQQPPSTVVFNDSRLPWVVPSSVTNIPLGTNYTYPAPAPYGYPVPAYPYPAPYGYPAPAYPYGYGYGNGTFTNNTTGYGVSFGRGGFSASIGGSNTTSRSSTTTTITVR